jgi:hypothetical protein
MYNLVVNLYNEKDITLFGLNRAKIVKNHNKWIQVINILWSSVIVGGKKSIPTHDEIA